MIQLFQKDTPGQEEKMSIFPTKILLATDGSEEAELALRTAVDLANSTDSELHILTVGRECHPSYEIPEYGAQLQEMLRRLERQAQEILDEQVRKIEDAGGTVAEAHLKMEGRPDWEIVRLSEEIGTGLIVMGSRGLGGLRRALLGSVSDSVVRHAHCPVLVVRPDKGSDSHSRHFMRRSSAARSGHFGG
jgi:nucleotide-binding universal stress UspA family protein